MLEALKNALETTGIPFAHYAWGHKPDGAYGVYAEDSSLGLYADGKMKEQTLLGTVDLYTRDDGDGPREAVQAALNSIGIAWFLNSIQFEADTKYIHYEWVFEVV